MVRIDGMLIDVTISESPEFEAEVTSHPVEKGSDTTDNMRVKPIVYAIEGVVSDTPRGVVLSEDDRKGPAKPSNMAYQRLLTIHKTKKLVKIISPRYGTFVNMALTKLSAPVTKDTGKAIHFTATFTEFIIVENNRTTIRVAVPNTGPKTKLGALQTTQWQRMFPNVADPIFVISFPVSSRASVIKTFGSPVHTSPADISRGIPSMDRYDVKGTNATPDGYLTQESQDNQAFGIPSLFPNASGASKGTLWIYHPISAGREGGVQDVANPRKLPPRPSQGSNGPVHFNYSRNRWEGADGKPPTQAPDFTVDEYNAFSRGKSP